MKIITPGYEYELSNFEQPFGLGQRIQFLQRLYSSTETTGLYDIINDGTTNEEVLAMLIDRVQFLNAKLPSRESSIALTKLEEALMWFNKRTANRKARGDGATQTL